MADGGEIVEIRTAPRRNVTPRGVATQFQKGHRPLGQAVTTYTEKMGERIAGLLAGMPRGLKWMCENVPDLPNYNTVCGWEDRYQDFAKLLATARRKQALMLIDECLEIADDASHDRIMVMVKGEPREVIDLAGIARAKIRIDTRVRVAKMFDPTRFGDRLDLTARVGGFASQDEVIDELD